MIFRKLDRFININNMCCIDIRRPSFEKVINKFMAKSLMRLTSAQGLVFT
jgi:hypothetical protein